MMKTGEERSLYVSVNQRVNGLIIAYIPLSSSYSPFFLLENTEDRVRYDVLVNIAACLHPEKQKSHE